MPAQLSFNPFVTTNAFGSFGIDTTGYIQGTLLDNPVELFKIAGGIVASTETYPMYGGIAISESIPPPTFGVTAPAFPLGGSLARASAVANITGFTVFNQSQSLVNTPQSPVPMAGSGASVNFVRIGSNVRLAVACDPALASLESGLINQQVSWDFNNQLLAPYETTATYSITSMTWSSTNGGQVAVVMAVASPVATVGDAVNISGATNSGTGGAAAVNGNFVVNTFADDEHFTFLLPAPAGVIGTIGGTMLLNYGIGAVPCKLLSISVGNSMTVNFNNGTGFGNWNRSGSAAVILI